MRSMECGLECEVVVTGRNGVRLCVFFVRFVMLFEGVEAASGCLPAGCAFFCLDFLGFEGLESAGEIGSDV